MYDRRRDPHDARNEAFVRRARIALAAAASVLIASCASVTYTRTWTYANEAMMDRLIIVHETFRLERASSAGVSVFEGFVLQDEERWVFDVVRWKPRHAAVRMLDPAVRYVYWIRRFRGAVSFLALERTEGVPRIVFIQPGDYTIER